MMDVATYRVIIAKYQAVITRYEHRGYKASEMRIDPEEGWVTEFSITNAIIYIIHHWIAH